MGSASRELAISDEAARDGKVSLLLISYSYPPVLGGSEIEAQRVCAALQQRGHRVMVLCAGGGPMPATAHWVDPCGLHVRLFGGNCPERWRGYVFALGVAWTLLKERRNYQVVYFLMKGAHLATGIPMAGILRKHIVMKFSGSSLITEMAASRLGRLELRFLRRWAARVMVLNPGMFAEAANSGLAPTQLMWMPNPVDTSEFCPCDAASKAGWRRELGLPEAALVVTFVGRLAPEKELPSLLRAFARVCHQCPEAMLVLVGDGPGRAELMQVTKQSGLEANVTFAGQVDAGAVRKWLQASDAFTLVSSLEGLPCSLIEAMAVGLPAVVTDIPAMLQLVDHEVQGLVVELRNENSIARALLRLLEDSTLRARLGTAARQCVLDTFSTEKVIGLYEELFRGLLRTSV
jgi:glycosyltransferase involved in cell wall biosynthesis